jgi:hypothetical protein
LPYNFPVRAEYDLRAAFRALGAVSPGTARTGKDLPLETVAFKNLLHRGVIREGAPGTFYLYEPPRPRGSWIRQLIFWMVLVILPIAIIQFCGKSP